MFFRKMKRDPRSESPDALAEIEKKIQEYESMIESAPQKLREKLERERSIMPPPDDLADRRRERHFYAQLSRGQIINERRYRTRNTVLVVLLAAATISIVWWIYSSLIQLGVLS